MKRITITLALIACACIETPMPPPEPVPDDRAINAAIAAWESYSIWYPELCSVTRPMIIVDARVDVMSICGEDTAGIVIGCFIAPRGIGSPILVTTTDPRHRTDTVVHEALHWLMWCRFGDPDGDHSDPFVWDTVYYDALTRVFP